MYSLMFHNRPTIVIHASDFQNFPVIKDACICFQNPGLYVFILMFHKIVFHKQAIIF